MDEKSLIAERLPPTELLYLTYTGNWLSECHAKVLSVEQNRVILDRSILHAQGGGQPTDKGSIIADNGATFIVENVLLDRNTGIVTHHGFAGDSPLTVGENVRVRLDEAERQVLSECHTAGHVVDSAMARIGKKFRPTKGYHFLDGPYVEYAGSIPPEERDTVVKELQTEFCRLVEENIETKIDTMSVQDANETCNRIAHNFDVDVFADKNRQIRVVTVAGYPCPCGGTHVRSTGCLKERKWNVTGLRVKKGVVRVKYEQNVGTDE